MHSIVEHRCVTPLYSKPTGNSSSLRYLVLIKFLFSNRRFEVPNFYEDRNKPKKIRHPKIRHQTLLQISHQPLLSCFVKEKLFKRSSPTRYPTIKIYLAGNRFAVGKSTVKQLKTFIFALPFITGR
jgi:hypothetical protein